MRSRIFATLAFLLGTTPGCRTEQIEPDAFMLADGNAQSAGMNTYLEIAFAPNASVSSDQAYVVLVDGRWVLRTPEDEQKVMAFRGSVFLYGDTLAAAPRTISLVAPSGRVALTTAPLTLTPGINNQLVVYGDATDLRYHFFANTAAELDAVPDGSILARVLNLRLDGQSTSFLTCAFIEGTLTGCAPLVSGLAYGQLWQGMLPRTTTLAVDCEAPLAPQTCMWNQLTFACAPPYGTELVPPKSATLGYMDGAMVMTFETLGTCGAR